MASDMSVEDFKQNFNINADTTDIKFYKVRVEPYNSLEESHKFGEQLCVLHHVKFTIFNVRIHLRILSFKYESHVEVLKLEITVWNELLTNEIAPCKNFLQRKRNINLTFEVLIKFTQLYEMRRLICCTVFQKQGNITVNMEDSGIVVKFRSENLTVPYLELIWSISWKVKNYEVSDFIEFYLNRDVLENECRRKVRRKLVMLAEPNYDFQLKLKLWKLLIFDLYGANLFGGQNPPVHNKVSDVLEISDSDSETGVIEIEESACPSAVSDEVLVIE